MISTFEKIDLLCSMLGIRLEHKHMKDYNMHEHMHYANFLSYGVCCRASPIDFKTIDSAFFFNSLWSNGGQLRFNNYDVEYVLECLIASNSFKIICEKNICIGNPFYKKFELISCNGKDEFSIMLDLLGVNDISTKNIHDVKKMLEV